MRRRDAGIVAVILVLASAFSFSVTFLPENVEATTLFVGGSGGGNFTTIQEAIDAATPGNTIYVFSGTYSENVRVTKALTLIGEDKETTIVQGDPGVTDVIQIVADWVNVTGFTTIGSKVGIELDFVENCRIVDNNVHYNEVVGISLQESHNSYFADIDMRSHEWAGILSQFSNNNVYENISASQNGGGISLSMSSNNLVRNSNGLNGIVSTGVNNTLLNNSMVNRGVALALGGNINIWTSHNIDESNTVAGKPVYYWKNRVGGKIPSDAGQVILANCTDVLVENFDFTNLTKGIQVGYSSKNTIANSTVSRNWYQGLFLYRSDNNTIVNSDFSNNTDAYEWWWLDYSSVYLYESNGNTFDDITVLSNNVSGMNLEVSHNNKITKSTFSANNWSGLGIHGSRGNIVEGNTISSNMKMDQHTYGFSGGLVLTSSVNTTVLNNTISSNNVEGLALYGSHYNWIDGNTALSNELGILMTNSDHNTIINGTLYGNSFGIHLDQSSNIAIENSSIRGVLNGIYLNGTSGNTLSNISVSECVTGISLDLSHNNVLASINASWNSQYGILARVSNNTTYVDNTVWGNLYEGIAIAGSNNTIARNNVFSNMWGGISLWGMGNNTIHNTSVSDNYNGFALWNSEGNMLVNNTVFSNHDRGIVLGGSSNNSVYHNSFVDNPVQAGDSSGSNRWDSGYPSGGNYWSDYVGVDKFYGPNQDQPGYDGIGDTRYDISGGLSVDRYPLMSPFEMIHPLPPTRFRAFLTGENLENVTLTWNLSLDDGKVFESVIGYRIYRNTTYSQGGSEYVNIATLPNGTSEFVDNLAGEGNPNNYFYRVCAVDLNNKTSCSGNQTAKFTRSLSTGLNLVSVPLVQYDENLSTILQTLSYDNTWSFDSVDQEWNSFMESKPYGGTLEYVNHATGFWVNVTQDSNITVTGGIPTSTAIILHAGWNLVGFPSFNTTYSVADLKAVTRVTRVEGFDSTSAPYFLRLMNDGEFLQAGHGYWAYLESDIIWTVHDS
jgi:parallel beta-helix repeat protein